MRIRPSDVACALVGVALIVIVFLPWWEFDADRDRSAVWTAYLVLYAGEFSPWNVYRSAALIWLATGVLAAAPAVATALGAASRTVRRVRGAGGAAGLVSLTVAAFHVIDPPTLLSPTAVAYLGTALTAVIALTAAAALRRPG